MNFGDLHGPLHLVVAATRYDQDSFLLVEVDTQTGVFDILNWNHLHWGSKFTKQEE